LREKIDVKAAFEAEAKPGTLSGLFMEIGGDFDAGGVLHKGEKE
jgi:hypothetical protein